MADGYYKQLKNDRAEEILKTTRRMICEKGVDRTGMSDIAEAVGISRQTLYKYFESRDSIAYTVQRKIFMKMLYWYLSQPTVTGTPLQRLEKKLKLFFKYAEENREDFLFTSIFDAYYNTHNTEGHFKDEYRDFLSNHDNFLFLSGDLAEGKADGTIRQDLDIKAASVFLINMLTAVGQRMALLKNNIEGIPSDDRQTLQQELVRALVAYLKP